MPRGAGSVKLPCLLCTMILTAAAAANVAAQPMQPVVAPPPANPEFFSRSDFHLNAAWLGASTIKPSATLTPEQQRFVWDTFWGGSIDVVDYVSGRLATIIDYEAVLGSEFQPLDPNQGNYTLEASASARVGPRAELVGIFHHVSRHLSDRAKEHLPVAFNELGARLLARATAGRSTLDIDAEAGPVLERAFVDYSWLADLKLLARMPLTPRYGVFAHVAGHLVGVDPSIAGRSTQSGGLFEAGLRINGRGGAMELFAGAEKRLDAYPLDREPEHWFMAGFRLLSR